MEDMDVIIQMYLDDVKESYNRGDITFEEYKKILSRYGETI